MFAKNELCIYAPERKAIPVLLPTCVFVGNCILFGLFVSTCFLAVRQGHMDLMLLSLSIDILEFFFNLFIYIYSYLCHAELSNCAFLFSGIQVTQKGQISLEFLRVYYELQSSFVLFVCLSSEFMTTGITLTANRCMRGLQAVLSRLP